MRLAYLDVARGVALALMVVNHTARYWLAMDMNPTGLIYLTTSGAGPMFLFLVGFVLPLSYRRAAHPLRRAVIRAAGLFAAGYAVNIVLAPEQPFLGSNVLHTIGVAVLLGPLTCRWVTRPLGRYALAAVGVGLYASFVVLFEPLTAWLEAHPLVARLAFYDFPFWPWLGLVFLGQALGAAAADGAEDHESARFYASLGLAGAVLVLAAAAWERWWPVSAPLGFTRDLLITNHWIPRGASVAWVLAWVFAALAACFSLTERTGLRLRALTILGRAALFLYVAHHVIVLTLVKRGLGVALHSWALYWLATALLLVGLVALAAGWGALLRRRATPAPAPADLSAAA